MYCLLSCLVVVEKQVDSCSIIRNTHHNHLQGGGRWGAQGWGAGGLAEGGAGAGQGWLIENDLKAATFQKQKKNRKKQKLKQKQKGQ